MGVNVAHDERHNDLFHVYMYLCHSRGNTMCVFIPQPDGLLWGLCSELRLSVHVALQPTFIYVKTPTSSINPLFLTTSVASAPFPFFFVNSIIYPLRFCLSCQVRALWVSVQLLSRSYILIMDSICFAWLFFYKKNLLVDKIMCNKHERHCNAECYNVGSEHVRWLGIKHL